MLVFSGSQKKQQKTETTTTPKPDQKPANQTNQKIPENQKPKQNLNPGLHNICQFP